MTRPTPPSPDRVILAGRHLDATEGVGRAGHTLTDVDVSALRVLLDLAGQYLIPPPGAHFKKRS